MLQEPRQILKRHRRPCPLRKLPSLRCLLRIRLQRTHHLCQSRIPRLRLGVHLRLRSNLHLQRLWSLRTSPSSRDHRKVARLRVFEDNVLLRHRFSACLRLHHLLQFRKIPILLPSVNRLNRFGDLLLRRGAPTSPRRHQGFQLLNRQPPLLLRYLRLRARLLQVARVVLPEVIHRRGSIAHLAHILLCCHQPTRQNRHAVLAQPLHLLPTRRLGEPHNRLLRLLGNAPTRRRSFPHNRPGFTHTQCARLPRCSPLRRPSLRLPLRLGVRLLAKLVSLPTLLSIKRRTLPLADLQLDLLLRPNQLLLIIDVLNPEPLLRLLPEHEVFIACNHAPERLPLALQPANNLGDAQPFNAGILQCFVVIAKETRLLQLRLGNLRSELPPHPLQLNGIRNPLLKHRVKERMLHPLGRPRNRSQSLEARLRKVLI